MPKSFFENIPKSTAHPVFAGEAKIVETKLVKHNDGRKYYAFNVRVLSPPQMKNKTIYMNFWVGTEDDCLAKDAATWKRYPCVNFGNAVRASRPELDLNDYPKATDMDKANADMKGQKVGIICTEKNGQNNYDFFIPGTCELGMGIAKAQPVSKKSKPTDDDEEETEELEVDAEADEEEGDDDESDEDGETEDDDAEEEEADADDEEEEEAPRRAAKKARR